MISITFDTDHMTSDGLQFFLEDVLPLGIDATFFCYRPFGALNGTDHEIAAHPYLAGSPNWIDTTKRLLDLIEEEANAPIFGLRPHSLMSSQQYVVELHQLKLKYISSICAAEDNDLMPFMYSWGLTEVPIRYMDNMDLWARDKTGIKSECFSKSIIKNALDASGLYCFDFHPIHILLNTTCFGDYDKWTRSGRPEITQCVKREGYGVRDFFLEVCSAIKSAGQTPVLCRDVCISTLENAQ